MSSLGLLARMARRLRWPLIGIAVLMSAASAHSYAADATESVAFSHAQHAVREARNARSGIEHRIVALTARRSHATARAMRAEAIFRDEANGVRGPGLTGMAGLGPAARRDAMLAEYDTKLLLLVEHEAGQARQAAGSLAKAIYADNALDRSAQAIRAERARQALLLALVALSMLVSAAGTAWPVRLTAGRAAQGSWADQYRSWGSRTGWAQLMTVKLVSSAVSALVHPDDQARYSEEWASDLSRIKGKWRLLSWSLLLRVFGPRGINAAHSCPRARRY
jgi:hypothetical protein